MLLFRCWKKLRENIFHLGEQQLKKKSCLIELEKDYSKVEGGSAIILKSKTKWSFLIHWLADIH